MKPSLFLLPALGALLLAVNAEAALVNIDFEDTTGTFPTGWTASGVTATTGIAPGSTTAALIAVNGTLTQDQWHIDKHPL